MDKYKREISEKESSKYKLRLYSEIGNGFRKYFQFLSFLIFTQKKKGTPSP